MSVDSQTTNSSPIENLITEHIDIWSGAIKRKSSAGRGSSKKIELYGIKKLRELILELAVRGKLVAQVANDEPASVLLERIVQEKAQLVKDKIISRANALPSIPKEDLPYDLPYGWSAIRLGDLTSKLGSGSTPRGGKNVYISDGVPFLRSQNIRNNGISLEDVAFIPENVHHKMNNTKVIPGDVLLNITGASLGRSAIFPDELVEANVSQHVTIIRLIERDISRFLHLAILSPIVQRLVWGRQVGMAIEGLSKKVLEMFEFPVPPLAEQHRIVAKVDELMALCDKLEAQTESSLDAHQTLVTVLLDILVNSQNAEELAENWTRISGHFDTLFTTEHSIDQLKQTILQLAVMGKLVEQNPSDEPASVLLERIAAEKADLIKQVKIKKQKPLPPITEEEKPFELPEGWEWSRLGSIVNLISGQHLKPNEYSESALENSVPYITGPAEFGKKHPSYSKFTTEFRALAGKGDILITCKGAGLGKLNTANQVIAISRQLMSIQPVIVDKCFLYLFIDSRYSYFQAKGVGIAIPGISREDVTDLVLILPPLEEQRRIVAKVDELMAICDQLKTRLSEAQTTQLNLADALVKEAL